MSYVFLILIISRVTNDLSLEISSETLIDERENQHSGKILREMSLMQEICAHRLGPCLPELKSKAIVLWRFRQAGEEEQPSTIWKKLTRDVLAKVQAKGVESLGSRAVGQQVSDSGDKHLVFDRQGLDPEQHGKMPATGHDDSWSHTGHYAHTSSHAIMGNGPTTQYPDPCQPIANHAFTALEGRFCSQSQDRNRLNSSTSTAFSIPQAQNSMEAPVGTVHDTFTSPPNGGPDSSQNFDFNFSMPETSPYPLLANAAHDFNHLGSSYQMQNHTATNVMNFAGGGINPACNRSSNAGADQSQPWSLESLLGPALTSPHVAPVASMQILRSNMPNCSVSSAISSAEMSSALQASEPAVLHQPQPRYQSTSPQASLEPNFFAQYVDHPVPSQRQAPDCDPTTERPRKRLKHRHEMLVQDEAQCETRPQVLEDLYVDHHHFDSFEDPEVCAVGTLLADPSESELCAGRNHLAELESSELCANGDELAQLVQLQQTSMPGQFRLEALLDAATEVSRVEIATNDADGGLEPYETQEWIDVGNMAGLPMEFGLGVDMTVNEGGDFGGLNGQGLITGEVDDENAVTSKDDVADPSDSRRMRRI